MMMLVVMEVREVSAGNPTLTFGDARWTERSKTGDQAETEKVHTYLMYY